LSDFGVDEKCAVVAERVLPELITALYGEDQDIVIETADSLPQQSFNSDRTDRTNSVIAEH
jgi:hypothetical protein